MKPAPFEYARAASAADAVALLAEHGADAKLIAGGQSLVPMMAMRLVRPSFLVDIRQAADLRAVRIDGAEAVIGACVRQCDALADAALCAALPLLAPAIRWIGHLQTRNRGTVGGSISHADPCAELPLLAAMLEAKLVLRGKSGQAVVAAADFFTGPMSTALEPDQCMTEVRLPLWKEGRVGAAFDEVSIRHGDFAIVSAAAQVALDASGKCLRAAVGCGGAGPVPMAFPAIAAQLVGTRLEDAALDAAADAVSHAVEPGADLHGSVEYRRHLAKVLTARVLRKARANAQAGSK